MMKKIFITLLFLVFSIGSSASDQSCDTAGELMEGKFSPAQFSQMCREIINSDPACLKVKAEKRMSCDDRNKNVELAFGRDGKNGAVERLKKCWNQMEATAEGFVNLVVDVIKGIVGLTIADAKLRLDIVSALFGNQEASERVLGQISRGNRLMSSFLNSSGQYFAREYSKNARSCPVVGNTTCAIAKTITLPFFELLSQVFDKITTELIPEYECMNGPAKTATMCRIGSEILFPPVFVIGFLKHGIGGVRRLANSPAGKTMVAKFHSKFADLNGTARTAHSVSPALSVQAEARILNAKRALKRDLNPSEMMAIQSAHDVGSTQGRRIGTYTKQDNSEKARILRRAGFTAEETRLLMERGITGVPALNVVLKTSFPAVDAALTTVSPANPVKIHLQVSGSPNAQKMDEALRSIGVEVNGRGFPLQSNPPQGERIVNITSPEQGKKLQEVLNSYPDVIGKAKIVGAPTVTVPVAPVPQASTQTILSSVDDALQGVSQAKPVKINLEVSDGPNADKMDEALRSIGVEVNGRGFPLQSNPPQGERIVTITSPEQAAKLKDVLSKYPDVFGKKRLVGEPVVSAPVAPTTSVTSAGIQTEFPRLDSALKAVTPSTPERIKLGLAPGADAERVDVVLKEIDALVKDEGAMLSGTKLRMIKISSPEEADKLQKLINQYPDVFKFANPAHPSEY